MAAKKPDWLKEVSACSVDAEMLKISSPFLLGHHA